MEYRKHIPFGNVPYLVDAAPNHQPKRALKLTPSLKLIPAVRNQWLIARIHKIIQPTAYDLFPREAQEAACGDTSVPVVAISIGDKDGHARGINDGPEQQFELFRAIFGEPASSSRPRGRSIHDTCAFRPSSIRFGDLKELWARPSGQGR